ncbi:MAG: hypothetical protein WC612_01385 [Bdellovibrionales bacterium]|jgi:intracellular multiplication protein IcmE
MTNNTDEFDQDQFDPMDSHESFGGSAEAKKGFFETVKNKPIVKLLVIMGFVGVALAGALGSFSSKPEATPSQLAKPPSLNEAPGGSATPFFIEQNDKANAQRVGRALTEGGSAMPTPTGHDVSDLTDKRKDPLVEFKAETERLKQEMAAQQKQNNQQLQLMQQQMQMNQRGGNAADDESLAKAMQKQMQQLMESWTPSHAKIVAGAVPPATEALLQKEQSMKSENMTSSGVVNPADVKKAIVSAGTVNYAQLLTEANSDVPGPILAQILSGPLSGGRAIGKFQVMNNYLVLTFNLVTYKGKEYAIDALALDPDTTLGGMATEVDHRYFIRVLLPAAGAFASAFGKALAETPTETTVSNGTVISNQTQKGSKEALYAGLGEVGTTVSEFFKNEANNTKTLVRVAVGTPMGLFFLKAVSENDPRRGTGYGGSGELTGEQLLRGYQQKGVMGSAPSGANGAYYPPSESYGGGQSYNQTQQNMPSGGKLTPSQIQLLNSFSRGY